MKEESNALVIRGQVGDARGSGLRGVRVIAIEATDRERADAALLLTATTGPEGNFELSLTMEDALRLFRSRDTTRDRGRRVLSVEPRVLVVTAYRGPDVLASTALTVTLDGLIAGPVVRLVAGRSDAPTETGGVRHAVQGQVVGADGLLRAGLRVEVRLQMLRKHESLVVLHTGVDGSHRGAFEVNPRLPPGSIVVRVTQDTDGDGEPDELVRSEPICRVPALLELDFTLPDSARVPSQFEVVQRRVGRVLGGVAIDDLTDDDLEHVVCVADLPASQVRTYVEAARLASTTGASATALLALGTAGIPLPPHPIVASPDDTLRETLADSAERLDVPARADLDIEVRSVAVLARARAATEATAAPGAPLRRVAIDAEEGAEVCRLGARPNPAGRVRETQDDRSPRPEIPTCRNASSDPVDRFAGRPRPNRVVRSLETGTSRTKNDVWSAGGGRAAENAEVLHTDICSCVVHDKPILPS